MASAGFIHSVYFSVRLFHLLDRLGRPTCLMVEAFLALSGIPVNVFCTTGRAVVCLYLISTLPFPSGHASHLGVLIRGRTLPTNIFALYTLGSRL